MKIDLQTAKQLLLSGAVVAIPTETVYGLAAWLGCERAIASIFQLKGRPSHNPLILHIADKESCRKYVRALPAGFAELADAFWPGPLTLILPIKEELIPALARASLPTAAFRVPSHPLTLELLQTVQPLVAPSANKSGTPSSTKPEHIEHDFGADFPVVDGGPSLHGVESTILGHDDGVWYIARLGAISPEELEKVLGYTLKILQKVKSQVICPGQLLQHYAPEAHLILSEKPFTECPRRSSHVVGYGDRHYAGAEKVYILGNGNDPVAVSHHLYDTLRRLDQEKVTAAWVDMAIPENGLWKTIRERLFRAAKR